MGNRILHAKKFLPYGIITFSAFFSAELDLTCSASIGYRVQQLCLYGQHAVGITIGKAELEAITTVYQICSIDSNSYNTIIFLK